MSKLGDLFDVCQGRLTLTSGTPVTTSDVTAATTVYFCPYKGHSLALYNTLHQEWVFYEFTERSITLSGLAADTNFDVFIYSNAGTLTLELVAWSTATARATALAVQDGIYCKTGELTKRYLGTIRTTSTIGQCEDSEDKRFCWNYYNRVEKKSSTYDSDGHTYSSATPRYWNNDSTLKFEMVSGLTDRTFWLHVIGSTTASGGTDGKPCVGWGKDSSSAFYQEAFRMVQHTSEIAAVLSCWAYIGYHYFPVLESSVNSETNNFWFIRYFVGYWC